MRNMGVSPPPFTSKSEVGFAVTSGMIPAFSPHYITYWIALFGGPSPSIWGKRESGER